MPFRRGACRPISARVSPLIHKQAGIWSALGKGVIKLVSNLSGKAGRELAEGAAKAVIDGSDNLLSGARHLWKGADKAVEEGAEAAGRAGRELLESTLHKDFAGDFAMRVQREVNKIHQSLSAAEAQAEATVKGGNFAKQIDDLMKNNPDELIQRAVGDDLGIPIPEAIKGTGPEGIKNYVRKMIRGQLSAVQQAEAQLHYIDRAKGVLREPDGLRQLKDLLDVERKQAGGFFGSGLEKNVPGLRDFMNEVDSVYKLDASNLNDTRFVQEAIDLATDPNKSETFKLFLANPKNSTRWSAMKRSPGFVGDMIKKMDPRISLKRRLIGVTPAETAKRLGLGVATLGAGYGAVKMYNWFGNNDPGQVAFTGNQVQSNFTGIDATGKGQALIQKTQDSVAKITDLANQVNKGLSGEDAAKTTRAYIAGVSTELGVITGALQQWDVVVDSAKNKNAAVALGNNLVDFVRNMANQLGTLSSQLGTISIPTEVGRAGTMDTNISKIQEFLNIYPSGRLDTDTVARLRALENEFNRRAGTDRFSGAFVVPEIGHIIDYSDLVKAYQKIQKY